MARLAAAGVGLSSSPQLDALLELTHLRVWLPAEQTAK